MADARDKAITAGLATGVPIHKGYIAEVIDAIPAGVLVDLAIERGALVPAYFNERLYERLPQGGGDG